MTVSRRECEMLLYTAPDGAVKVSPEPGDLLDVGVGEQRATRSWSAVTRRAAWRPRVLSGSPMFVGKSPLSTVRIAPRT
jgi:hypothetical protein